MGIKIINFSEDELETIKHALINYLEYGINDLILNDVNEFKYNIEMLIDRIESIEE